MVKAYAKVNYHLSVIGQFEDGYHQLVMINDRVKTLYDKVYISKSFHNDVYYSLNELNHLENNICLNILNYMYDKYNFKNHYDIYIKKNIPLGAGLGGGSSDAACIINELSKLESLNLSIDEKVNIARLFGSDIPYCIYNIPCLVEGYGELITPIKNFKRKNKLYLILPDIHSETKKVFSKYNKSYSNPNKELLINSLLKEDYKSLFYNDLEESSFNCYPKLYQTKFELSKLGICTMSGSGSSFILCATKNKEFKKYLKNYHINFVKF